MAFQVKRRAFLGGVSAAALGVWTGACGRADGAATRGEPGGVPPLHESSGDSAGAAIARSAALPTALGVQLYTLREPLAADLDATLDVVAAIGYGEVERAGLADRSVADWRIALERTGLRAVSSHDALETILDGAALDTAAELGQTWVAVPWIAEERRTPDGYRALADDFNRAGTLARDHGLGFAYHNHAFEFEPLPDGTSGWEILLERTDPQWVTFQLDVFWAVDADRDPVRLLTDHAGRFSSLHVKDRAPDGAMVDVGRGAIAFDDVLRVAPGAGVRHLYVEHDRPDDPLASVRTSHDALVSIVAEVRAAG